VIWNWQERAERPAPQGGAARARWIGSLQGMALVALGAGLHLFWSRGVGTVVLTIGSAILVSALVSPTGLYAAIRRFFTRLGHWTGSALNWLLMPALFYAIFYPLGRVLRRGRRDRLRRWLEPEAETYWEPHEGFTAASTSPEKQY
jgi:hypothetical protein